MTVKSSQQILFIQGGGESGYDEDTRLVDSLRITLGATYEVHYPKLNADETLPDFGWLQQINKEINSITSELILVGHSLGASMILKCLTETQIKKNIIGIFLIATPFWSGNENWIQELKLKDDFAEKLRKNVPVFLYHCRDDEEIPFEHLSWYKKKIQNAIVREIKSGGHQLNYDLSLISKDIKSLDKNKKYLAKAKHRR